MNWNNTFNNDTTLQIITSQTTTLQIITRTSQSIVPTVFTPTNTPTQSLTEGAIAMIVLFSIITGIGLLLAFCLCLHKFPRRN